MWLALPFGAIALAVVMKPATDRAEPPESGKLELRIGGGAIDAELPADPLGVSRADLSRWIETAGNAVSGYFGRYPVRRVRIEITATKRGHVHGGITYDGELIRIHVGRDARAADLDDDWMLTHEMFHLGFPDLDEKYLWMNEGLSDYLEPLARARIGNLTPEKAWAGFVEGMPKGQPEPGDRGLDRTHTWGRTYWGGCTFWLLADLQIREKTQNRRSLDDAVKAILAAGGDGSRKWPLDRLLDAADQSTGTTVLHDLHAKYGEHSEKVDLDGLWARLGIRYRDGEVTFDEAAPLAGIRKSMTDKKHE